MLNSGKPSKLPQEDRFGYAPYAMKIADAICSAKEVDGLVMALYGAWGSGKSSILNYIRHFIAERKDTPEIIVVQFESWWFSGRDDLVRSFFGMLAKELEVAKFSKSMSDTILRLGHAAARLPIPIGFGSMTTKGVAEWGAAVEKLLGDPNNIPRYRSELSKQLQKENRRIVVIIDDIDRLHSKEILDLFRVIKAIADLPNVTYLLAFDKDAVVKILRGKLGVSGEDYLEKIVQVQFQMPRPNPNSYIEYVLADLHEFLHDVSEDRMLELMRLLKGGLTTPRRVTRLVNSISIVLPELMKTVDPVDFLILEMIRLYCPEGYNLIRNYPYLMLRSPHHDTNSDKRKSELQSRLENLPDEYRMIVSDAIGLMFNCGPFASDEPVKFGAKSINNHRRFVQYFSFAPDPA